MRRFILPALALVAASASAQSVGARVGPQFVSYTLGAPSNVTISEMAIPIFAYMPISRALSLDIGTSFASANVKSTTSGQTRESKISGLTDTQIRATMNLGSDRVLVTAGVNIPTGQTTADTSEQMAAARKSREVLIQLSGQKIVRAAYSDKQLEEVLADFWFNHFNVFAGKGATELYLSEYEREAIRPHVLGKFRDLLGATAKSPAMLFYLDNWQSADPEATNMREEAMRRRAGRFGGPPPPNMQNPNAQARQRCADPDEEDDDEPHLRDDDEGAHPVGWVDAEGHQPAAEEQRHRDARDHDHVRVLREQVGDEGGAAVLGEVAAHQLGVGLDEVERSAVGLRE